MDISWRDIFVVSLIVLIIGVLLAFYGIIARSEGLLIASSILILFPIPFVVLSYKALRGEAIRSKDLYNNAIIGLAMIAIVSLSGYFLFATTQGKALSLAVFLGTTLSLIVEYAGKRKNRGKKYGKSEDKTAENGKEHANNISRETTERKQVEKN